jgi:hypothetical protein
MRLANLLVFDDVIRGTGVTWYTASKFDELLGRGDGHAIQAVTTDVSGSARTLTVVSQHSTDGQHWAATGSSEIVAASFDEGTSLVGSDGFFPAHARKVRFAISLGGVGPWCRLKLWVTTRGME